MMTDKLDLMKAMLGDVTPEFADNPHWDMHDGAIVHRGTQECMDLTVLKEILTPIQSYFKAVFEGFNSEAQVLVVTPEDYEVLKPLHMPEILVNSSYKVLVLPQQNTWGNTIISESFWQKEIVGAGLTPLMRIHSHHVLDAYQSNTDWSTLNSGTLEVVIGKVFQDVPQIAYWLDVRGTNNKDNVFRTLDLGASIMKVKNGNVRYKNLQSVNSVGKDGTFSVGGLHQ